MASMVNRPLASHFTIDVTWQSSPLIKYTENSVPRVLVYSFCMACIPHRPCIDSSLAWPDPIFRAGALSLILKAIKPLREK